MATSFNCPNCGAQNTYTGEGNTTHCAYCGSEVPIPAGMVNEAAAKKLGSRARTWIILFIVVVFVIPVCVSVGGGLLGFLASIFATIVSVFASFLGH